MNKQKYITMVLTFIVLILITPLIFSKLMNFKLNKMVKNLNKNGYFVKLIENKSTYLKTDKIFLVEIPGKKLNNNFINKFYFKIETIFYNLPVTKVDFKGILEKIDLAQKKYEKAFNSLISKKFKFFVTTPNFKVYNYKVYDISLPFDKFVFNINGIEGVFEYSNLKTNKLNINHIALKGNNVLFEVKNFKNNSFYKKDNIKNENSFSLYVKINNDNFECRNIKIYTNTQIDKKTNIITKFSFDSFISKFAIINNFVFNLNLLGLDTNFLFKITNEIDPILQEKDIFKLLKKGLQINLNSKVKNIELMQKKFGYCLLKADIKVLPDKNLEEDIKENNLKFINSHIYFESTPKIATLIVNIFPKSAFIISLAKKEGSKVVLDLSLKNSKLYANGEEIK